MIQEALKLNLGSRDKPIPGFISIDCDPHSGVGEVGNVADLSVYPDGTVQEIYASHILEHFPHRQTLDVLKEWSRVLMHGGILYVAVPDFKRTVDLYRIYGFTDWVLEYLWGGQEYMTAYHFAGFDFQRLSSLLIQSGFREISQVEDLPVNGENDCSTKVSNHDGRSVSLNIVAVK